MARTAPWTYELPAGVASPAGIEAFVVESAEGERLGKVAAVLRRNGDVYLAIQQGDPPLTDELRALPWSCVEEVETDRASVRLTVAAHELDERALVLDPEKQVERGPAEAERVVEPPSGLPVHADPAARGPSVRKVTALLPFAIILASTLTIAGIGLGFAGTPWAGLAIALVGLAAFVVLVTKLLRLRRDPYVRD